jgi:hypothetical protein
MNNLEEEMMFAVFGFNLPNDPDIANGAQNDQIKAEVQSAVSIAIKWLGEFRDWYDKLSPAEKCTVWPPAGSGSGTGLYNMQTVDIVDKFIRYKTKLSAVNPEPIIGSNVKTSPPNETQKV